VQRIVQPERHRWLFIAIQVSNWNESRIESNRASGYLDRIHEDLKSDIETLGLRQRFWDVVLDNGYAAIDFAEKGVLHEGSEWSTLRAFLHASQIWNWSCNNTHVTGKKRREASAIARGERAFPRDSQGVVMLWPPRRQRPCVRSDH
jgi:hypothetical protein